MLAAVAWLPASPAASGQTPDGPLSFEVASLKRASAPIATKDGYTAGYNAGMRAAMAAQGIRISGRRVSVIDNTLRDLIRLAYQVKDYQISAPAWMAEDKFEVAAIMPAGADRSQVPAMLRTLLEQRFHMVIRREKQNLPAYALVQAKGGAMLTPPSAERGGPGFVDAAAGRVRAIACSLDAFADLLTEASTRTVVNVTGIAGLYDFALDYAPESGAAAFGDYTPETAAAPTGDRPTLESAVRQLGLRIEKRQMPIDMLVVERADREFTEN